MNSQELKQKILQGKIFIYPTDTLYGLGCNALNKKSVSRIRDIKKRDNKPFSLIAPSFEWISKFLIVDVDLKKYLPGKYTIILKKKNPEFLSWVSDKETLGVRIPDNEFCFQVQKAGLPFITTSVNFSGEKPSISLEEIPEEIKSQVDIIIKGKVSGKPSILVIEGKEIER
jgi:L-threonylcarbamoyladenylate synthase